MNLQREIGRRIVKERREFGITLQQLSKESGVTIPALVRLEHGRGSHIDTLGKVLDALSLGLEVTRNWDDRT